VQGTRRAAPRRSQLADVADDLGHHDGGVLAVRPVTGAIHDQRATGRWEQRGSTMSGPSPSCEITKGCSPPVIVRNSIAAVYVPTSIASRGPRGSPDRAAAHARVGARESG
jgi:hypothetical protein